MAAIHWDMGLWFWKLISPQGCNYLFTCNSNGHTVLHKKALCRELLDAGAMKKIIEQFTALISSENTWKWSDYYWTWVEDKVSLGASSIYRDMILKTLQRYMDGQLHSFLQWRNKLSYFSSCDPRETLSYKLLKGKWNGTKNFHRQ